MNLSKEDVKKLRGLILFTIFVLVALWNYQALFKAARFVGRVFLPFMLGGAIAFIINVPMNYLENKIFGKAKKEEKKWAKKIARPVSFVITLLLVILVISVVMFVVIPELGRTGLRLGKDLQAFIPKVQVWATSLFQDNEELVAWIQGLEFNWSNILKSGLEFLKTGAGTVLGSTVQVAKGLVSGLTTFFIAFVFACYVLLQKENLERQVKKLLKAFMPEDWRKITLSLASVTYKSFSNFLTGQCLEAIILGAMFFIAMTILRMPYALLIGVVISFTALIPIFGAFIGCFLGAFLIFIESPMQAVFFVIMFLILQQIEGNFIYPYVVGNSVGLPSIWVLVAVSVGASLMGIVGMLIFIPLTSVFYSVLRGIVNQRLGKKE